LGPVVRERVFDNFNNFNQRIFGLLPETARSMLPFSFESENRTVRGILSMGGRELLLKNKLTGSWLALDVAVEPQAPYRISGIALRPSQPPSFKQPAKKLTDARFVKELKAFMQTLVEADVFSGAVLLAQNGKPIFKQAYGEASKEFHVPNRVDTKFNLGSMNKMFTSVAIAQLVEQGKMSFDDALSSFLPNFPDESSAKKIRIKHLLTHTSGLGNYFTEEFFNASRARFRTVDDMMKLVKDDSIQFQPGTRWAYSNTGMLVLGKVIEKVTGESYFDYVRKNIYEPAGMINTDCYELDRVVPQSSTRL
jgi:CubicO group peptidase (beta-lactamase class C family)